MLGPDGALRLYPLMAGAYGCRGPAAPALGRYFRAGPGRVLADRGEAAQVIGDGPLAQVAFSP